MTCSEVREALSAGMDGEDADRDLQTAWHLAACGDCTTYAARLGELSELSRPLRDRATRAVPEPSPALMSSSSVRSPSAGHAGVLRLGVAALAAVELAATVSEFVAVHGYSGEDHAAHESLSFTFALCVGMFWVAWRPSYARSYLPMVGVAAALLTTTTAIDLSRGRAHLLHELPHLTLVLAFVLLWLLSREEPQPGVSAPMRGARPRVPAGSPGLRVIRGALRSAAAVAVASVVLVAAPSWGHATLEGSDPATGTVLKQAPPSVTLRFDEAVTTLPESLEVYGPDGARVDDGAITRPGGVGSQVSIGVAGDQRGTYLVSWRVISADSHPVSGAFTFSVGRATTTPTAVVEQTDKPVAVGLGASRWLGYVGIALTTGGIAFLMICWPEGWAFRRSRCLVWWGLALAAVGGVASILLKGPYDAALGVGHLLQGDLLQEVLGSTYGYGVLVRLGLLAVVGGLLAVRQRVQARAWAGATGIVTVALLPTFAVTGHAVSDHPRWLALAADTAHVGAMSVWLGGLVFMVAFVLRSPDTSQIAHRATRRFSSVALMSVLVLVSTGTYQAWRQVRSWKALPATTYGRELLVKLTIVAAVLLVAGLSRSWVRRGTSELSVLRKRVGIEAIGVVLILGVTSALVATEPARSAYHPSVSAELTLGPDTVRVSAVPTGDRRMLVHLDVFGKGGLPTEPAAVQASLSLPSQRIGPLSLTLTRAGKGRRAADVAVPVVGTWTLSVVVRTTAIDEFTQYVSIPIH